MPPSFPRQNQAVVLWSRVLRPRGLAYGAVTLYGGAFQPTSATAGRRRHRTRDPATPHPRTVFPCGFSLGSPPFGRPYSGDPCWFLLLPLLRCFRSGGSHSVLPRRTAVSRALRAVRPQQEVPFGDPGFDGCMRLPRAYRRLPRPSSAPEPSHPPGGVRAAGPGAGPGPFGLLGPMRGAHRGDKRTPTSALHPGAQGSWAASMARGPHTHHPRAVALTRL